MAFEAGTQQNNHRHLDLHPHQYWQKGWHAMTVALKTKTLLNLQRKRCTVEAPKHYWCSRSEQHCHLYLRLQQLLLNHLYVELMENRCLLCLSVFSSGHVFAPTKCKSKIKNCYRIFKINTYSKKFRLTHQWFTFASTKRIQVRKEI